MGAQPLAGRAARIGLLIAESASDQTTRIDALRQGLIERGWVEGRNLTVELRAAAGAYERLPGLAAELAGLRVDVIVAFGIKALTAATGATATTPIVIPSTSSDLIALGFAESYARPGRHVTGSTSFGPEIMAKRLELLKETLPMIARVGVLINAANASFAPTLKVMESAAQSLKVSIEPFKVRDRTEFAPAFAAMAKARITALVIQDDTIFGDTNDDEIAALAARSHMLAVGGRDFADAGGAMGYGRNDTELYRRGAHFVDRILNGVKPAELPIERASRFELVINLRMIRSLGLKVPQGVSLRADRVIG